MNWEPDFIDFAYTTVASEMNPLQAIFLLAGAGMLVLFVKSTKGKAFILKTTPWKRRATEFRDQLVAEYGFKNKQNQSEFDGTFALTGTFNDQPVRVEISSGSRGFNFFEGFTVAIVAKIPSDSIHSNNIFPKRLDDFTSIHGQELIRLVFMKTPDIALFRKELEEAISMTSKKSHVRIAA